MLVKWSPIRTHIKNSPLTVAQWNLRCTWQAHPVGLCTHWAEIRVNHFSVLRQEIKGIGVAQKPSVHLWSTPRFSCNSKASMLFFCVLISKKKKKSEGDIWAEVSLWKIIPYQLAEGGRDELGLEGWCWLNSSAHSFLYLAGILLLHFNSHSSLKSPLRCRSHFLWFVF